MLGSSQQRDTPPVNIENRLSVTRALIKLKTLTSRIEKIIPDVLVVTVAQNGTAMQKISDSSLQQVQDLIKYRSQLKSALAISNATEKITVAGVEYTVAAAIERKRTVDTEKQLLRHLEQQYSSAEARLETLRMDAESRAERLIMTEAGKDSRSTDPAKVKELREAFLAGYNYDLVDTYKMREKLPELRKHIEDFEGDIDAALSEKAGQTFLKLE